MIKAKLIINGEIGSKDPMAEMFGVIEDCFSDKDCQAFLNENKDADEIDVEITSPGGSVEMGFRIHDMLVGSGKVINTIAYKADSIATVIFLAGSTRLVAENCTPLVHNPMISLRDGVMLNATQLGELKAETETVQKQLLDFYTQKLSLDKEGKSAMQELMDKNSPISAKEFLKLGFATDIIKTNMSVKPSTAKAYNLKMVAIANHNSNNKMEKEFSALQKTIKSFAKILGFKALEDGTLEKETVNMTIEVNDGTQIFTDTEGIEIGVTKAFTDEGMTVPAADGDYVTVDGDTITVAVGVVSNLVEMDAQSETELAAANAKIEDQAKVIEALKKTNANLVASNKTAKTAVSEIVEKYNEFSNATLGSKFFSKTDPIVETFQAKRLREMREARMVGQK